MLRRTTGRAHQQHQTPPKRVLAQADQGMRTAFQRYLLHVQTRCMHMEVAHEDMPKHSTMHWCALVCTQLCTGVHWCGACQSQRSLPCCCTAYTYSRRMKLTKRDAHAALARRPARYRRRVAPEHLAHKPLIRGLPGTHGNIMRH